MMACSVETNLAGSSWYVASLGAALRPAFLAWIGRRWIKDLWAGMDARLGLFATPAKSCIAKQLAGAPINTSGNPSNRCWLRGPYSASQASEGGLSGGNALVGRDKRTGGLLPSATTAAVIECLPCIPNLLLMEEVPPIGTETGRGTHRALCEGGTCYQNGTNNPVNTFFHDQVEVPSCRVPSRIHPFR